jgi:hypothetical protein
VCLLRDINEWFSVDQWTNDYSRVATCHRFVQVSPQRRSMALPGRFPGSRHCLNILSPDMAARDFKANRHNVQVASYVFLFLSLSLSHRC